MHICPKKFSATDLLTDCFSLWIWNSQREGERDRTLVLPWPHAQHRFSLGSRCGGDQIWAAGMSSVIWTNSSACGFRCVRQDMDIRHPLYQWSGATVQFTRLCKLKQPQVDIGPPPYYYESFTIVSARPPAVSLTANVLGAEAMTSPLSLPPPTLHRRTHN